MNIVYLHAHDAGRYLQPYGYSIPTPNLQQLAEESVLFRHAYTTAPTCSPSRSAMLTGMSPHECGMLGLAHRGFTLKDPSRHLAHYLRAQGYHTVLSGVQHEFRWQQDKPYDEILEAPKEALPDPERRGAQDRAFATAAAKWLRKRDDDQPFFLACGFVLPHRDFPEPDPDINPDYVQPPAPLPDNARTRYDMAAYMTAARAMDEAAGIVLDALREAGLEGETLILWTVDHGIAFPWMKCNLYDTGMGVAMSLKYPGNPMAGKATDALVSHLDVFPTLCDLAGLQKPDWLTGYSLKPLLDGKVDKVRDEVFGEVSYHAAYEPMRAIRTERYKLIKIIDKDLDRVPANVDDSPSKDVAMHESGLLEQPREPLQLYDLVLDPNERHNLINDGRYEQVRRDLEERLKHWMESTDDPLLSGSVDAPKGAHINTRSNLSPTDATEEVL